MVAQSTSTSESGVAGLVARFVAGAAIGPALFGGGLLRLVAVLLFGIAIGAIGAWLLHRWLPNRCGVCATHHHPVKAVGRARVTRDRRRILETCAPIAVHKFPRFTERL
jgi:zinc transporter ZupT